MKALCIALVACGLVACFDVRGPFRGYEQVRLTIRLGGSGAGVVESVPPGLTCDAGTCSGEFNRGATVQLFASATEGAFLGWTEACRGKGECAVKVEPEEKMGALFGQPGEALWVTQIGGADEDVGRHLAIDSEGDIIAVGTFEGTIAVGSALELMNPSNFNYSVYVAKLDGVTGEPLWAKKIGNTNDSDVLAIAVDEERNLYIAGTFSGTVDFGGGPVTSAHFGSAAFILALDTDGRFRWVRNIDGVGFTTSVGGYFGHIATNGDAVVFASRFSSEAPGDGDIPPHDGLGVFALTVSAATGNTRWVKIYGGNSLTGIALDSAGNAVLTGMFQGSVYFDDILLTAPASSSAGLLLKLASPNGKALVATALSARPDALAVDQEDHIVVAGTFGGSADLGCASPLDPSPPSGMDLFLAQYTQAGSCLRAQRLGSVQATSSWSANALAVDASGEVALAGAFNHSLSLGGPPLQSAGGYPLDMYAARFDRGGNHLGSLRAGGTSSDEGRGIAQSSDGRFFVTGSFEGFAEFGRHTGTSSGSTDAFIASFAPF